MSQALSSRLVLFGCALLLLVTGCGPEEPPPVPTRTEQAMALFPDNARFVGMVDLQDLQTNGGIAFSSERGVTVRFLDSDLTFNPLSTDQQARLQAFIEATGFEPGTDLHAAYAIGDSLQGPPAILLAAEVNSEKLVDHLLTEFENRVDTSSYRGTPLVRLRDTGQEPGLRFALLHNGWIAVSPDPADLRAIVDQSLDNGAPSPDDATPELVAQVAGRGGAWLVARDLSTQRAARSADDRRVQQVAQAVRDVATALNFEGDGITGTVLLTTDRDAGDLASVVRGLISAGKLREGLTEEQRRLLDKVTVIDQEGQVWIHFEADQETLARLLIETMQSDQRGGRRTAAR